MQLRHRSLYKTIPSPRKMSLCLFTVNLLPPTTFHYNFYQQDLALLVLGLHTMKSCRFPYVWLLSFSIMFLRYIRVVYVSGHSCIFLGYCPWNGQTTVFYSPFLGHLDYSQFGANVKTNKQIKPHKTPKQQQKTKLN